MKSKLSNFLLELLYGKLAFLYDLISNIVSLGRWTNWQSHSLSIIKGQNLLDIGCGTGSLMVKAHQQGYMVFGLDISKNMLNVSKKKLSKYIKFPRIVQADMSYIPIKDNKIDTVILTFPTNSILNYQFYKEVERVLQQNGRIIIVDYPKFNKKNIFYNFFNFLSNIGDQRDISDIKNKLTKLNFTVLTKEVEDIISTITLIIADKKSIFSQ